MTTFAKIQVRRDTANNFLAKNPTLDSGEWGYEEDTGKTKIGDAKTSWVNLPYQGLRGPVGPQGTQGVQGLQGQAGAAGPAGPQGLKGDQGERGLPGPTGPQGNVGPQGEAGPAGPQGPQGIQGEPGPKGDEGPQGPQGNSLTLEGAVTTWPPSATPDIGDLYLLVTPIPLGSVAGQPGDGVMWTGTNWINVGPIRGPQGERGIQGPSGSIGSQGPQGPQGPKGDVGPQGIQGIQGQQGPAGSAGPQGSVGPQGPKGDQGEPGVQGIQGLKGDAGPAGPAGPANVLAIGTVTKGDTASATITGTPPNQVLNLVLPCCGSLYWVVTPIGGTNFPEGTVVNLEARARHTAGYTVTYSWQSRAGAGSWVDGIGPTSVLPAQTSPDWPVGSSLRTVARLTTNNVWYRCVATTLDGSIIYSPETQVLAAAVAPVLP
jgi:hypothetical protein